MVLYYGEKCFSFETELLLAHRKQTILRCSVENWPELGMERLLVTFVTSLSVKWRLMTSFYRMSNKLFTQTRKTKILRNEGDEFV